MNFLVIEDDELSRIGLMALLKTYGESDGAENFDRALGLLKSKTYDMVFIDLDLDYDLAGHHLLQKLNEDLYQDSDSRPYCVVVSGREEEEHIEKAYKLGCRDYLGKPYAEGDIELVLRKYKLGLHGSLLGEFLATGYITGDRESIDHLKRMEEIVFSDRPILIQGETGTGKTLIGKFLHQLVHGRDQQNFVHLNCAEIPESLMESELFGHKKGAFSGAIRDQKGKLEMARGGTLFLDEVGTMPMAMQKKLLRVIEEKCFYPVGSERLVYSDFRLVSATCEDLREMVAKESFRKDLYHRIEGFNLHLKPLRQRKGDIRLLVKHFLRLSSRRIVLSREVKEIFDRYPWPGNVRELQKVIEVLKVKGNGIVVTTDLPDNLLRSTETKSFPNDPNNKAELEGEWGEVIRTSGLKGVVEEMENKIVAHYFSRNHEKVRPTMEQLKIASNSFYKIRKRILYLEEGRDGN